MAVRIGNSFITAPRQPGAAWSHCRPHGVKTVQPR
jgi:hypothetical protein